MGEKITKEEWIKKGKSLFGDNMMNWKFICPGCGNIQTPEEFRQFKDKGANPSSAYCECIGRYKGGKSWMNSKDDKSVRPCDYASYGLFDICPVTVIDGDKRISVFAFWES